MVAESRMMPQATVALTVLTWIGMLASAPQAIPQEPVSGEQASGVRKQKQDAPKVLPEYELKAGFLFQFAKYVEWPPGTFSKERAPILVGIVGEDPFGPQLVRALKDKVVKGREFEIVRFAKVSEITRCHMLFVPRSEASRLPEIIKHTAGWPVLTIGEDSKVSREGGTIAIVVKDEKPTLEVNLQAAQQAGLTIDSKLLRVSEIVKREK
jgi:hypothetical protein